MISEKFLDAILRNLHTFPIMHSRLNLSIHFDTGLYIVIVAAALCCNHVVIVALFMGSYCGF